MPQDFVKAEQPMDHLVQEIRENLQLGTSNNSENMKNPRTNSSVFKMKTFRRNHNKRSCPYGAPPSSRACDTNCKSSPNSQLRKWNHQRRRYPSTCLPANGNCNIR